RIEIRVDGVWDVVRAPDRIKELGEGWVGGRFGGEMVDVVDDGEGVRESGVERDWLVGEGIDERRYWIVWVEYVIGEERQQMAY
uniref:hypothetical protein n=1 Tax=Bacillus sp. WP8 TaxID=756828 RepID=UPI001642EFD8